MSPCIHFKHINSYTYICFVLNIQVFHGEKKLWWRDNDKSFEYKEKKNYNTVLK